MKDKPKVRKPKPFADLIRQRKAAMDVPFSRIADRAGISRAAMSQYVSYDYQMKRLPSPAILQGLATAMGVPLAVVTDAAMRTVGMTTPEFDSDLLSELKAVARGLPDQQLREVVRYTRFLAEQVEV